MPIYETDVDMTNPACLDVGMTNSRDHITNADLDAMLARYSRALDSVGVKLAEGERLILSSGSKTYGIAFRLNVTGGQMGSGHGRPPVGDDFLGFTKREAFETLATTCRAMEDIAYLLSSRCDR